VELAEIGPVVNEPLIFLLPLHAPEATQTLASLLLQASVAAPPDVTVVGVAFMVTVGTGRVTETVAD
jgi:hypothetical protein